MAVRSTMAALIAKTRLMIFDPAGVSQVFDDQTIQDKLDEHRDDVRYELLDIAPTIANTASTGNTPSTIYADYYSKFKWWESDVILQGNNTTTGASWIALTPTSSDYIVGHWMFENTPFVNGTVPGQYPPVFATGKIFDLNLAAAELLDFRLMALSLTTYDFSSDGQSFRRSQAMDNMRKVADGYRQLAKPRTAKMVRSDVSPAMRTREMRLLDSDDIVRGR